MQAELRKPWHAEPADVPPGVVAEYARRGEPDWRRVAVDPDAGTVTFFRCHRPASFWSVWAEDEYTCPLAELVAVRRNRVRHIGPVLEVVTPRGRARFPESAEGFAAVRDALSAVAPATRPKWHELDLVKTFVLMLILFPAGFGATLLVSEILARKWVPDWLLLGPLMVVMFVVVAFPLVAWRRRKSMW